MKTLIAGFASLAMVATPAAVLAGGGYDAQFVVEHIFDVADQNEDRSLSLEEFDAAGLQQFGLSFAESDTNADGGVSILEYLDLYRRYHSQGEQSEA